MECAWLCEPCGNVVAGDEDYAALPTDLVPTCCRHQASKHRMGFWVGKPKTCICGSNHGKKAGYEEADTRKRASGWSRMCACVRAGRGAPQELERDESETPEARCTLDRLRGGL